MVKSHYTISCCAFPQYPVKILKGNAFCGKYQRDVYYDLADTWGGRPHTVIIEVSERPLPDKIELTWLSVMEQECYSLNANLDILKAEKMWKERNVAAYDETFIFTHIICGLMPEGNVAVWLYSMNKIELLQVLSASKIQLPSSQLSPTAIKEIYDMTYQNFSENVANFISGMVIELKKVIVDYGQRRINKMILDDEIDNTKYELRFIDYYKFCVPHSKEFNERYLEKKLEYLFTEFQAPGYGTNRNQNKDVIKYIRDNYGKQLFANHFLDNNFYELVNEFVKNGLNKYLETKNNEQKKSYIRNNIVNYGKRIDAFNQIITTLCNNFKEYSTSF